MSEPRKGKGRGRRTTVDSSTPPVASSSRQPKKEPNDDASVYEDDDAPMQDAVEDDSSGAAAAPAAATTSGSSSSRRIGTTSTQSPGGRARPVGGLLSQSEYAQNGKRSITPKLKFVPNARRRVKAVVSDDDEDVKREELDNSRPRGRGRGRRGAGPRRELEMTASGPMAQGPGGAPKNFGGRSIRGAAGAGVMNASRNGTQLSTGRYRDAEDGSGDEEAASTDEDEGNGRGMRLLARELDSIGREDEMAPLTLPRDPKVERLAEERRKERHIRKLKTEHDAPRVKPDPEDESRASSMMLSSANATPGLDTDSKTDTLDSKSVMIDEDFKEIKPEDVDLGPAFNLEPDGDEQIYMFQFPRKFPKFVNADSDASKGKDEKPDVKLRPPLEWGRAGSRREKAARWGKEEGQIGELLVHRSGKVSLKINNDLTYEILPAAQPSFLQEIAILDDKELNGPPPGQADSDDEKPAPSPSLVMIGQTSKKFLVVPEVTYLLDKVLQQEKEEKELEQKMKAVKREKASDA